MADLNHIRARLPGARSEAAKPPERGQPPPLQQDAFAEARSSDLELELEHERSRREELDAVVAALQDELSTQRAEMEQLADAQTERDLAMAEQEQGQDSARASAG